MSSMLKSPLPSPTGPEPGIAAEVLPEVVGSQRKRMELRRLAPTGRRPATVVTKAWRCRASRVGRSELSVRRHEATKSIKSSVKHVWGNRGNG